MIKGGGKMLGRAIVARKKPAIGNICHWDYRYMPSCVIQTTFHRKLSSSTSGVPAEAGRSTGDVANPSFNTSSSTTETSVASLHHGDANNIHRHKQADHTSTESSPTEAIPISQLIASHQQRVAAQSSHNSSVTQTTTTSTEVLDATSSAPASARLRAENSFNTTESLLESMNPILIWQRFFQRRIWQPVVDLKVKVKAYYKRFQEVLPKIKIALTMIAITSIGVMTWLSVRSILQKFEEWEKSAIDFHHRMETLINNLQHRWEHRNDRLDELKNNVLAGKDKLILTTQDAMEILSKADESLQKASDTLSEKRDEVQRRFETRLEEVHHELDEKVNNKLDLTRWNVLKEQISTKVDKLGEKLSSSWPTVVEGKISLQDNQKIDTIADESKKTSDNERDNS
jgi:hypothetical protein